MSTLIPTNLSNAYKGKRKPDIRNVTFSYDYPASVQEVDELDTGLVDEGNRLRTEDNGATADKLPRKRNPVPVALVDPDPVQMMDPDEYGAELGKEARVWKVYAQETDKWDRELVDGWNKSLDVILVFAALFSAVSTSFLIESSGMLKQDPNDISATALVGISQALLAIARNSTLDPTSSTLLPSDALPLFVPPQHVVVVNTLWFLSLSLSIATSLLAMLAKDWCHSFIANRTGHPWDQALRRQRKWVMIEHWKMQELITVLPSLIHLSLLLFAIGLCIHVWDLNMTATIPVVCVTGASIIFYLWSSLMASLVKLFPYTTIISTALQSGYAHRQYQISVWLGKFLTAQIISLANAVAKCLIVVLEKTSTVLVGLVCLPLLIVEFLHLWSFNWSLNNFDWQHTNWQKCIDWTSKYMTKYSKEMLLQLINWLSDPPIEYIKSSHAHIVKKNEDQMISLALQWLIQNCETPSSVAIALQAIAGASSKIPTEPLKSCQATLKIFQRLVSSSPDSQTTADTKLYTRALEFLESNTKSSKGVHGSHDIEQIQSASNNIEVQSNHRTEAMEVLIWDLSAEHEQKVVELISTTQILPTKENIEALSIGSSATSLGLRLLKGDPEPACEVFGVILERLRDIKSGSLKLDQAALQSLTNAALVLTLCSQDSSLFFEMVQVYIKHHILSLPVLGYDTFPPPQPQPTSALVAETALVACVLSHPSTLPQSTAGTLHLSITAYAQRAVIIFTGSHMKNTLSQAMFYRVGLLAILSSPEQYGITSKIGSEIAKKQINMNIWRHYLYSEMLLSHDTQRSLRNNPELNDNNPEIIQFLSAVDRVFQLPEPGAPQNAIIMLPAPIYWTLVFLSCAVGSDTQQTQCQRLLSNSVFPRLDNYFVAAIQEYVAGSSFHLEDTILRILWNKYQASELSLTSTIESQKSSTSQGSWHLNAGTLFQAQSRHFLATQFWLVLALIDDSSTRLQQRLKSLTKDDTDLKIRSQGVDSVRVELEDEIIQGYEQGHQFGLYSARVIECILEGRNVSSGILFERITQDLKDVPLSIRGRSSFLDSPANPELKSNPNHLQLGPALVPNSTIHDVPTINPLNQQLSTVKSATSISVAEGDKPSNTVAQSSVGHVMIPVLPGAVGTEND